MHIILPGNDTDGCAPGGSSSTPGLPWNSVGNITRFNNLCTQHVLHPLLVKVLSIEIMQDCDTCDLSIACIPRPFPVGTITGDATMHVIGLTPSPYLINIIEQLVGCLENGRWFNESVHRLGCKIFRLQLPGPVCDLHTTEYKPVKPGSIGCWSVSTENV